jgi:hypothetical protein
LIEPGSDVHFNDSDDADVDAYDEDAACLFCAGLHSEDKHRDRWVQCIGSLCSRNTGKSVKL